MRYVVENSYNQKEMDSTSQVQILVKAFCISHHSNALEKSINTFLT